jgi:hypothetical protein
MDKKSPYSLFAITGFILGIASVYIFYTGFILGMISFTSTIIFIILGIIPALGIIFSSIGIFKTGKEKKRGKVLAIIGLVLSTIIFIYFIYFFSRLFDVA